MIKMQRTIICMHLSISTLNEWQVTEVEWLSKMRCQQSTIVLFCGSKHFFRSIVSRLLGLHLRWNAAMCKCGLDVKGSKHSAPQRDTKTSYFVWFANALPLARCASKFGFPCISSHFWRSRKLFAWFNNTMHGITHRHVCALLASYRHVTVCHGGIFFFFLSTPGPDSRWCVLSYLSSSHSFRWGMPSIWFTTLPRWTNVCAKMLQLFRIPCVTYAAVFKYFCSLRVTMCPEFFNVSHWFLLSLCCRLKVPFAWFTTLSHSNERLCPDGTSSHFCCRPSKNTTTR